MSKAILITQCLQNDFVVPINKFDKLPNQLHIGSAESRRLLGESPEEGMLMNMMSWAYGKDQVDIINIRDWHNPNDPHQKIHLNQFGMHCLENTKGAEFVFENLRVEGKDKVVNASGLNDFIDTPLLDYLNEFKGQNIKVGIVGVWTEAKVSFLAYDIVSRFPEFEVAVCGALTASSSTHMHFIALEQLKSILGVSVYPSITEFMAFLSGEVTDLLSYSKDKDFGTHLHFDGDHSFSEEDLSLMKYLYRNSKEVDFKVLDGGFSGNVVLKADANDIHGHEEVPTVLKIGPRNPMAKERDSFEKIRDVLGNSAPGIVEYVESENRGGIKYRYASMFDEKVVTFQKFYGESNDFEKIRYFIDVVFKKQLGKFYKAASLERINLMEYYDFKPKYKDSVKRKVQELLGEVGEESTISFNNLTTYNICNFYEEDLTNLSESYEQNHFSSYLHGDLNGANIIIDAQENVWLIDFFHTHRGHVLKDLIKLENDILYIFAKIENEEELIEASKLVDLLLDVDDLWDALPEATFKNNHLNKALKTIAYLRSLYRELIHSDRSPYQLHIGLMRYSVHTLSFDECNIWQRKLALYASGKLAEKIKKYLSGTTDLRVDYLEVNDELKHIGMTLLPGRKDRSRNLDLDIDVLQKEGIKAVFSLLTKDELNEYGIPNLLDKYQEAGLEVHFYSIVDQTVPTKEEMHEIVEKMRSHILSGNNILVHCVGGVGRTGTAVASYLRKYYDYSTEEAIEAVRKYRSPRAVETKVQEDFIADFI